MRWAQKAVALAAAVRAAPIEIYRDQSVCCAWWALAVREEVRHQGRCLMDLVARLLMDLVVHLLMALAVDRLMAQEVDQEVDEEVDQEADQEVYQGGGSLRRDVF